MPISPGQRITVIGAALLALFLGALDALVMSAAMPTIVADLGGLQLYSWVYSPIFWPGPSPCRFSENWPIYTETGTCLLSLSRCSACPRRRPDVP